MKPISVPLVAMVTGCGLVPSQNSSAEQPKADVGRYVIVHSPQVERDTVLLDTATGKTWERVTYTDLQGDADAWEPMARADNGEEMDVLRFYHPPKDKKTG